MPKKLSVYIEFGSSANVLAAVVVSAVPQLENTHDVDLSQSLRHVPYILVSTERLVKNL